MRRKIRVTLTGLTPLVLNRSFWESVNAAVAGTSPAPPKEFALENEIYRDEQGRLALPSVILAAVLNYQAAHSGLLPKKDQGKDFTINEKWVLLLDPATHGEALLQVHTQPTHHFTAAQAPRWSAAFTLEYDDSMTPQLVHQAVSEAGSHVGIGAGGRKNQFGRFHITGWEELNEATAS